MALAEMGCVLLLGGALALGLNALSPRGLELTRNYFPTSTNVATAVASVVAVKTNSTSILRERLAAKGLQVVERAELEVVVRDRQAQPGKIVVLDARNTEHFNSGHIPGALQFDHYRAADHLAAVIPACLAAERIILYCTGGECEDSEFAALMLRDAGIPAERLFIFPGGITEWKSAGLPVQAHSNAAPAP
jgi:rhodanese-related sulfurtransferase